MKRKGLSVEQKREKLLNIFHERKEVFNLKDVEKLGCKAGITLQTVKPVLDELISDNLVETDKIGSANLLKEMDEKLEKLNEQKQNLEENIVESMKDKEPSEERTEELERLVELKKIFEQKEKQINQFKRNDPLRKKEIEEQSQVLKAKTNHWIDQLFEIKKFLNNKGMSDEDVQNGFEIPADIDNI